MCFSQQTIGSLERARLDKLCHPVAPTRERSQSRLPGETAGENTRTGSPLLGTATFLSGSTLQKYPGARFEQPPRVEMSSDRPRKALEGSGNPGSTTQRVAPPTAVAGPASRRRQATRDATLVIGLEGFSV
jgi:hypothetical protein